MINGGIYSIVNIKNHMLYIGSAINLNKRFKKHIMELRKNIHRNKHLQRAWIKYGENSFIFMIREYVEEKSKLLEREQWWIDRTNSNKATLGYNIRKIAKSNLGLKWSDETKFKMGTHVRGIKRTEEYKKKMSEIKKGLVKSPEWQAKINASPNLASRTNKEKWPHGCRCNCKECSVKHKQRHLELKAMKNKPVNYILVNSSHVN